MGEDVIRVCKEGVYRRAANMRSLCGIYLEDYPLRLREICEDLGILLEELPLRTQGLRGIAVPGNEEVPDVILLSNGRSSAEQNFDVGHEWYHLAQHRGLRQSFNCLEQGTPKQDQFLEWQANEGAAELAVPYALLLPRIVATYPEMMTSWQAIADFKAEQAAWFGVSEGVIKFRLESLRYEIAQAAQGIPLNRLRIWSAARQRQEGVWVESLNERERQLFHRRRGGSNLYPTLPNPAPRTWYTTEQRRRDQERLAALHRDWLSPG